MIEITVERLKQASVVTIAGEIDAISAALVQERVLPISVSGCKIILDMSKVAYMSSAGLRILLSIYRQISSNQGKLILVGLSEELKETMSMTGFLDYFTIRDTLEMGFQVFG